MMLTVLFILAILTCLWLWQRLRLQEKNSAVLMEYLTGDAVIAFAKSGRINSIGPRAKMIFGLEGRVDSLMLSDIPVLGFMPWLSHIEQENQAGEPVELVNRELKLESAGSRSHASKESSAGLSARLAAVAPEQGIYPAFVSFAFTDAPHETGPRAGTGTRMEHESREAPVPMYMDFGDLDDPEYLDVAADFLTGLDHSAQELARSIQSEDWESVEALASHLCTAAATFGLPEISEASSELVAMATGAGDRSVADMEMKRLYELVCGVSGHVLIDSAYEN